MQDIAAAITTYVSETRRLESIPSSTEATFYPAIRSLLSSILDQRRLPFEVRTNTSEAKQGGTDMPDFVLGDKAAFVGVYGEVKRATVPLDDLAASAEQNDQIGRYLARTGVVLLCNVRSFGLLACAPGYERRLATTVPPSSRELIKSVDLWSAVSGSKTKNKVDESALATLVEIVERSITDYAPIADPADLAKVLARQARDAKDALPEDLKPVQSLLDDYRGALGLAFSIDDPKGDRFFRSSLVQTAFYSVFAAWVLWDRDAPADASFTIEEAAQHLAIPFLSALLHDLRHPQRSKWLGLDAQLGRAIATLNRVDRKLFRARMTFPALDEQTAVAAITYFYEPFLEAFDPQLREDLGVWYTPPEIVQYQVGRVHYLLKSELGRPLGLADPDVYVLDPCCGTGAYLLEVARCIAAELKASGDESTVGLELTRAFQSRIIGFEILTAPFAIAQLQLHMLLRSLGAQPREDKRLAVYLTNALSGWNAADDIKLHFPEMRQEYDASRSVKRNARIIVILGNPPYDRFAGAAQSEEKELVAHYKGIKLVVDRNRKDGTIKRDEFGAPQMKQQGKGLLYLEYGVRKSLLDDLYIRFLRLAEQRIGEAADYGIVSFISNSSYLTGRSHPLMRRSLLSNFHEAWIDNLNGDKYRTGKLIPQGLPGGGSADQSVFTTALDPRGIQPGTAIVTWIKRPAAKVHNAPTTPKKNGIATLRYRDFWGLAASKRRQLVTSLPTGDGPAGSSIPSYSQITSTVEARWRLAPRTVEGGFEAWPALDELFPLSLQGVNHNRGYEGSIVDTNAEDLRKRVQEYFSAETFDEAKQTSPEIATERARYNPENAWRKLKSEGHYRAESIVSFLTFPFDQRFIYYADQHKWLNEARPDLFDCVGENEFFITVPEPRKVSEALPVYSTVLMNHHVHERGSAAFPAEVVVLADRNANIHEQAWRTLQHHFGLEGLRRDDAARRLVRRLFRLAFAVMHAPAYQREHASALASDWAHLPVPKEKPLFDSLADAGERVARLIDANRDAADIIEAVLGKERSTALGGLHLIDGGQVKPTDLRVTVTYWGGGKGRWKPRPFLSTEQALGAWGERTGDLFINETTFFANVPEAVWTYQVGGYPVLKKWLGYRQADRRAGAPLSNDERRWFRTIIQRIAALLALGPELDRLYQDAVGKAFTAAELGISR
ncbi:MAG: N-6 DNA methylase [Alphaproteobacteria bacterium]|nr:N-6 DNA methylase [Alphaproteobacteria bacterium]MCW5740630.1 N-6 DNA methylase [Alphaproteobacteria bacterium]